MSQPLAMTLADGRAAIRAGSEFLAHGMMSAASFISENPNGQNVRTCIGTCVWRWCAPLHPAKTFSDKISLKTNPADMQIAKSYINCTEDRSLPHHYPRHPRLSQKLGLFRLVQVPGSHELCFSNPKLLAQAIMDAGRD